MSETPRPSRPRTRRGGTAASLGPSARRPRSAQTGSAGCWPPSPDPGFGLEAWGPTNKELGAAGGAGKGGERRGSRLAGWLAAGRRLDVLDLVSVPSSSEAARAYIPSVYLGRRTNGGQQ